ncbi:hypothetical protein RJP56_10295 [Shewanella baltica]|uniref:hypothetical protein n=1 Tax=Shewanella baltica TaxID=62322 RepID=UPI002872814A|nr:hypothetical protein [Shewanella baltica]MDR9766441.1 hypothetical protein [Shewanella baltica]
MGFLNRLFGKRKEQSTPEPSPMIEKPSEKEIFESPSMLAAWVDEFIVRSSSVEDDFNLAPDEDVRDSLNITYEQVERLAREEGLLRAVGACFLIKQYYDDSFYLKYFSAIYKSVAMHMYSEPTPDEIRDTRDALESYVNFIVNPEDEELKEFKRQYLYRIYDDNNNFCKLMLAGIGSLPIYTALATFELMRDAYYKVTQGIPYESAKLIVEAMEKVE